MMIGIWFFIVFLVGYVLGVYIENRVARLEKHNSLLPDREEG